MRKVTTQSAVKFFKGLVCRFGVPNRVITDNGTQFTSHTFMQYIQDLGCKVCFASVAHPRRNGQAERENAKVLRGLRTKTFDWLLKSGKRWIDELSAVLWSIRTTPNRATGQTPFALVYGAEAVLPTELTYGSPRVLAYDELEQERLWQDDAMLLEEDHLWAAVRAARYQQALRRYHSRKVHARSLEEGDCRCQNRRIFGRSEQCQIEPPARHPLPWYTGQKQFSPRNSHTGHLECSLMTSLSKSNCGKMTQRSLRKIVFGQL